MIPSPSVRTALAALALLFLAAHLRFLPPTLEDIDSINFALGVADFDVARHQPHPPGYPVFIALGKASTGLLRAAGVRAPEPRGLAIWSALSGGALIVFLFVFFRAGARPSPADSARLDEATGAVAVAKSASGAPVGHRRRGVLAALLVHGAAPAERHDGPGRGRGGAGAHRLGDRAARAPRAN